MMKNVHKIFKILCFDLKYYVPHKLHVLRYKFQNFPDFLFASIILNDIH